MPPKKKGKKSGKKGKKSGKKSAKVEEAPKEEENLNNSGKEFFLIQIHDLEKRLVKWVTAVWSTLIWFVDIVGKSLIFGD